MSIHAMQDLFRGAIGASYLAAIAGSALGAPASGPVVSAESNADTTAFGLPPIQSVSFTAPTKDTSTYSNIGASGNTRPFAWMSTFPAQGRQSNLVTMFDTEAQGVPTGADAQRVLVLRMRFTACTYPSGPRALYDASPDAWQNTLWAGGDIIIYNFFGGNLPVGTEFVPAEPRYIDPGADERDNAPVELFGVRFNNEWSAETWIESGLGTPAFQNDQYNAEPIDFDAQGTDRSVLFSMGETAVEFEIGPYVGDDGQTYETFYPTGEFLPNPVDGFDPNPLAIGRSFAIPDGTPGHSINGFGQQPIVRGDEIPPGHRLGFDVGVNQPGVQQYLRDGFAEGWVSLMASQLAVADIGLNGAYSYWLTKEGSATLPPVFDLDPSTLEFDYLYFPPGDFDGNGVIAPGDDTAAIWALTDPDGFNRAHPLGNALALTDMDGDGDTDLDDIASIVRTIVSVRGMAPHDGPDNGAIGG